MKVFLGSTYTDLADYRAAVIDALRRLAVRIDAMELWLAQPGDPLTVCLERVAEADVYLCIVAHRYGSSTDDGRSFTEREYEQAIELGKDCLVFMLDETVPVLPSFVSVGEDAERLARFKHRLAESHVYAAFESPTDLAGKALRSVQDLFVQRGVAGADTLDFDSLWQEVGQAWLGVDPADMRLEFDPADSPEDLLAKLNECLDGIDDFRAHVSMSTDGLQQDLRKVVERVGGDTDLLEAIPYYENPFVNRDWAMITMFPNRTARARILIGQLLVHALHQRIQREGLTPELDDQLQAAKEALKEAVQSIAID